MTQTGNPLDYRILSVCPIFYPVNFTQVMAGIARNSKCLQWERTTRLALILRVFFKLRKIGKLVSRPSISPENVFLAPDGTKTAFSMGSAYDQQVISPLFEDYLQASALLNISDGSSKKIEKIRPQLASGSNIDGNGRLLEWSEFLSETNPQSGHISHLLHSILQIRSLTKNT